MTTLTEQQIDLRLDGLTAKARSKHPSEFIVARELILGHLEQVGSCYIDEMDLSLIPANCRNVIGTAVRSLLKEGKIARTGAYKRSQRPESNGRVVFMLRLKDS